MRGKRWADGYSSHVEIYLLVNGEKIRVSRIGPDSFVVADQVELPPATQCKLVIRVDDHEEECEILLTDGVTGNTLPARYF
ncbi:MAG TPA: hypothetical protein VG125_31775 [Pirellulales bacterium]|jgi:hypothetical protein|nr:hypothetical protein [Pirellulales bacterium]